jgi:hypothetical protein
LGRRFRPGLAVLVLFAALTVLMTWPQARHLSTHVPDADDPLLSIWRIAWIAHALPTRPADLLNGNIFYPEKRTLAYTDSVLLQGFVAAPAIWLGVAPIVVYNLLILVSMALSGAAMWLYARQLTGSASAGVIAGIAFSFVPFRFDHFQHLELQATMFMPLTLWCLAGAFESGNRRDVWGAIACLVAQVYCGIYYAVFLVTALLIVIPLQLRGLTADRRKALVRAGVPALAIGALLIAPYLAAYVMNRGIVGERSDRDVLEYSATARNYLATLKANLVHGWWSAPLGHPERRLFPGAIALVLAGIGLIGIDRRRVALLCVGLVGLVLSLGLNTPLYEPIRAVLLIYRGLRAPARASILVYLALAALAAFGWARLEKRLTRGGTPFLGVPVATAIVASAMLLEYATPMKAWFVVPPTPQVYGWLADQPRAVVLELPVSTADRLDIVPDGLYMFRSTAHWQPILNGYSGFFPQSYLDLTERVKAFPDDASIEYLKKRGVDLIILHGGLLAPDRFGIIMAELLARPDIRAVARYEARVGPDVVFRLVR